MGLGMVNIFKQEKSKHDREYMIILLDLTVLLILLALIMLSLMEYLNVVDLVTRKV